MTSFSEILEFVDAQEGRLAEAIGRFSMRFAELEGDMDWAIARLLGTTEARGRITMAAIRNVTTRLDIFAALVESIEMPDDVRSRLQLCAHVIGTLNNYRNTLLHNKWGGNFLGNVGLEAWTKVWTETSRRKSQRRTKTFTADEIKGNGVRVLRCRIVLQDAVKAYQEGCALEQSADDLA